MTCIGIEKSVYSYVKLVNAGVLEEALCGVGVLTGEQLLIEAHRPEGAARAVHTEVDAGSSAAAIGRTSLYSESELPARREWLRLAISRLRVRCGTLLHALLPCRLLRVGPRVQRPKAVELRRHVVARPVQNLTHAADLHA